MAKPQVGVGAGAEPGPGWRGGVSAGAREQPQGWAGGALPGRGGPFPASPWPAWARWLGAGTGLDLATLSSFGDVPLSPAAFMSV